MEHNTREVIRMKVLQAEQIAVNWDKNLVWNAVHFPEKQSSHRVFYYVAASLLLTATLVYYSNERTRQIAMEVQLKSIEQSINQQTLQASLKPVHALAGDICPEIPTKAIQRKPASSSKSFAVSQPVNQEQLLVTTKVPDSAVISVTTVVKSDTIQDSVVGINKVQSIIGQTIAHEMTTHDRKGKKLSFRLFPKESESRNQTTADNSMLDLISINNQQ